MDGKVKDVYLSDGYMEKLKRSTRQLFGAYDEQGRVFREVLRSARSYLST